VSSDALTTHTDNPMESVCVCLGQRCKKGTNRCEYKAHTPGVARPLTLMRNNNQRANKETSTMDTPVHRVVIQPSIVITLELAFVISGSVGQVIASTVQIVCILQSLRLNSVLPTKREQRLKATKYHSIASQRGQTLMPRSKSQTTQGTIHLKPSHRVGDVSQIPMVGKKMKVASETITSLPTTNGKTTTTAAEPTVRSKNSTYTSRSSVCLLVPKEVSARPQALMYANARRHTLGTSCQQKNTQS